MDEIQEKIAEILIVTFPDQCELVGHSLLEEVIVSTTRGNDVEYSIPKHGSNISFLELMSLLSAAASLVKVGLELYDRIEEKNDEKLQKEILQFVKKYPRFSRVSQDDQIKLIRAINVAKKKGK